MNTNDLETLSKQERTEFVSSAFKIASELASMGHPVDQTLKYLLHNEYSKSVKSQKDNKNEQS